MSKTVLPSPGPFSSSMYKLQCKLKAWKDYNFPDSGAEAQFMGMVEELGELSHAMLKRSQGIRGSLEEHNAAMVDAVGDLLIFTMQFCSENGWDMEEILEVTASQVMLRDWVKYPKTGFPPQKEMGTGQAIILISQERRRQQVEEGFTRESDLHWMYGDLFRAAQCYFAHRNSLCPECPVTWPFMVIYWKPKSVKENLVRAGALCVAELERSEFVGDGEGSHDPAARDLLAEVIEELAKLPVD